MVAETLSSLLRFQSGPTAPPHVHIAFFGLIRPGLLQSGKRHCIAFRREVIQYDITTELVSRFCEAEITSNYDRQVCPRFAP